MTNLESDAWHWYLNISECYYHIQLTVEYRRLLINEQVQKVILTSWDGLKERYAVEVNHVGFDQNHIHILCRFLPKYSVGRVIKILKSISAKNVFKQVPETKEDLWGGEFWTDGYYVSTVSGRGSKSIIIKYIENQGRKQDVNQLKLFDL